MITLTENAAKEVGHFKEIMKSDKDSFLRVGVSGGGCSGFQYELTFDNKFDEKTDTKYESHGQTIIMDKKSALYMDDTEIDFYDDGLAQRGFSFNNPNAKNSCGCGSSFSA